MKQRHLTLALLLVAAFSARAATVTGNMLDIFGNAAGTSVRFVPSGPLAIGTNTYLDYPRSARITNGLFSVWLAGGFYDADFVPYTLKPIRVLVWPSDTNTYTFNQAATLAVNAAMFNGSNLTVNAYVTTNVWTVYATNIPAPSLGTTNPPAADKVLTLDSNTNLYWATPAAGGGEVTIGTNTIPTDKHFVLLGETSTNAPSLIVPWKSDAPVMASGGFAGKGLLLTDLNASELSSGTVPLARLGTNTASAGQVLASDATNLYWTDLGSASSVNLSDIVWESLEVDAKFASISNLDVLYVGLVKCASIEADNRIYGDGSGLINLPADQLTGTVPLARLSGITSNELDAATWEMATNQSGGSGTPIRAGTNVVIYEDTGTNVINAVGYNTLTNVALRDVTVPLSLVATNRDANTNHFMLWFAPDGTNSTLSTLRWTQKVPVSAQAEITFWPGHSSGYPELIVAAEGSLCFYYNFIQWGQPSHVGPTYEYWKSATYSGDYSTGTLDTNLSVGATWCFQAYCWTNTGYTNACFAGSLGKTTGNTPMPTLQFRATSTNGSGAWIFMDNFDPSAISSTTIGTTTYKYYADTMNATERLRITAGPDGGLSFNGSLTVNGAVGITTNYTLAGGDVLTISNGIIVYIGAPIPYAWHEEATNYLGRIGTEPNCTLATNVNELVADLKSSGVLSNLECLYPLCGANPESNAVNLISSDYKLTWTGSFLTNDWTGIDNGGTDTNYADTGWTNPHTNSGTLFAFVKHDTTLPVTNIQNLMCSRDPYFIGMLRSSASANWYHQLNVGLWDSDSCATNSTASSFCAVRSGATNSYWYQNGSQTASCSSTRAAKGVMTNSLYLFDCNTTRATVRGQWRGKALAFAMGTNALSGLQYKALHDAVAEFNTRMGR